MATRGELTIARAHTFLGHKENPLGSNTDHGGMIDLASKRYGLHAQPWCNSFCGWVIATTPGLGTGYKNGARAIMSPATQTTWERAQHHGWAHKDGDGIAPVGSIFIRPGTHIGFVWKDHGDGTFTSLEGNHGDMVASATRSWSDWNCIIIPGTGKPAPGKGKTVAAPHRGATEHGGKTQ